MPAINVSRTDTFESQRQKINEIGANLFQISQGGSDLSTGLLKIGDGTIAAPSLAFISDSKLGLYKSAPGAFGVVSGDKKIFDFATAQLTSYKDFVVQRNSLSTGGMTILNAGKDYDPGTYDSITLLGGTGENATIDLTVTAFVGTVTVSGQNYLEGSYSGISLNGGTGSGAIADFSVEGIQGLISAPGSGYLPGNYQAVPLNTNPASSANGATADILIEGTAYLTGNITPGSGYTDGSYAQITLFNQPTTTYTITTVSNPGTPPPDNVYQLNGVTQDTITLIKGNTYRFITADASNQGHPLIFVANDGQRSQLDPEFFATASYSQPGNAGAFIDLIIKPGAPNGTILYDCQAHPGMGAVITITTGTAGSYGSGSTANIDIGTPTAPAGQVGFVTASYGNDYQVGDVLSAVDEELFIAPQNGSGFEYTVTGENLAGEVTGVTITSNGQNYTQGQIVEVNNSDVGGFGAGFQFLISNEPGTVTGVQFNTKGSGYTKGDVLTLPGSLTGITGDLKGNVSGLSTTLSSASTQITVASTTGIVPGMEVGGGQVDVGQLAPNTTVSTVDSSTTLTLSDLPTADGFASLSFTSPGVLTEVTVSSTTGINSGDLVTAASGNIPANTTVSSVDSDNNLIEISNQPTSAEAGAALTFSPSYGVATTDFEYTLDEVGVIESFDINIPGSGYFDGDELYINNTDLVQPIVYVLDVRPTQIMTFTGSVPSSAFSVGQEVELSDGSLQAGIPIYKVVTSGSFITALVVGGSGIADGDIVRRVGTTTDYTVNTMSAEANRYFIDTGSGNYVYAPDLTLFVNNTYTFNIASISGHPFRLSKYPDGIWGDSLIEDVVVSFTNNSATLTMSDTTGIVEGMSVTYVSGDTGINQGAVVSSVDSGTSITLSLPSTDSGSAVVTFAGVEYTDGVVRSSTELTIKVTNLTPTLYYYCELHPLMSEDAVITINPNNPRTFGSEFSIEATVITEDDVVSNDVETGMLTSIGLTSTTLNSTDGVVTNLESTDLNATAITTESISATTTLLSVNSITTKFDSDINVDNGTLGTKLIIEKATGNLTSVGSIKSQGTFNSNDKLIVENNEISTTAGSDLLLSPFGNRIAKVDSTSALVIPVGNNNDRPLTGGLAQDGAIRFNTDTNQYEGYSGTNQSWSSLGGVRDLDGNTTILAEETVGANDNTLWFINDSVNTLKFTPDYHEYTGVKKIRSVNVAAPDYKEWAANDPSDVGDYIKYQNNIYEVTAVTNVGGTNLTGTSGTEPTDVSGNPFIHGDLTLQYFTTAVGPITFEEVSEIRIDPLGFTDLVINNQIRLSENQIITESLDLELYPNDGQKVKVRAATSLVVPVGDNNQKGNPERGSIRYNTDDAQFEGFNGAQWGGLGGVKDIDQDTKIEAETAPNADEDILYFYNAGNNTLRIDANNVEFDTIDTITSGTSDTLNVDVGTVTFDSLATTLSNTSATESFLFSTKDNFDIGLSSGLNNDHLLRLTNTGNVIFNLGFGTGTPDNLTLLNSDLTTFNMKNVSLSTVEFDLTKGTNNAGNGNLYNVSTGSSAKVIVTVTEVGGTASEITEYLVVNNGSSDVCYTETGNIKCGTSSSLFTSGFDFDGSNNVRLTITAGDSVANGQNLQVIIVTTATRR